MKKAVVVLVFLLFNILNVSAISDTNKVLVKLISINEIGENKVASYQIVARRRGYIPSSLVNVILNKTDSSYIDSTCFLTIYSSDTTNIPDHYYIGDNFSDRILHVNFYYPDYKKWVNDEPIDSSKNPEIFVLQKSDRYYYLIIPSFGSATSYNLSNEKNEFIWNENKSFNDNPTFYDLTKLKSGFYYLSIMSCHIGGIVEFQLKIK